MPELVTNGAFTGGTSGWTLTRGWVYSSNFATKPAATFGTEMVTNGDFTGGTSGWTLLGGAAYSSNNVHFSAIGDGVEQAIALDIGDQYRAVWRQTNTINGNFLAVLVGYFPFSPGLQIISNAFLAPGLRSIDFVPLGTPGNYSLRSNFAGQGIDLDDVSVKKFTAGGDGWLEQALAGLEAGKTYLVEFDYSFNGVPSASINYYLGDNNWSVAADGTGISSGHESRQLAVSSIAVGDYLNKIRFAANTETTVTIDNVSVTEVLPDTVLDLTETVHLHDSRNMIRRSVDGGGIFLQESINLFSRILIKLPSLFNKISSGFIEGRNKNTQTKIGTTGMNTAKRSNTGTGIGRADK